MPRAARRFCICPPNAPRPASNKMFLPSVCRRNVLTDAGMPLGIFKLSNKESLASLKRLRGFNFSPWLSCIQMTFAPFSRATIFVPSTVFAVSATGADCLFESADFSFAGVSADVLVSLQPSNAKDAVIVAVHNRVNNFIFANPLKIFI